MTTYEEAQVEEFYNREDGVYRSFWDSSGSLHWGYFPDLSRTGPEDFTAACHRWTDLLLEKSGIGPDSHVLDLGCGNGNTSIYLAQRTGCKVTGIDISGVRIENARARAQDEGLDTVDFHKASASQLPFAEETFTHVWSQATLYHVPDREQALSELHRVLAQDGRLVMDDLVTPSQSITEAGRRSVYERLMFEPGLSHEGYANALREKGFMLLTQADLTPHLRKSYELLAERTRGSFPEHTHAYQEVTAAIDAHDVGWSSFVALKVGDPLEWIYDPADGVTLQQKYDTWATTYEKDLIHSYQDCPRTAAAQLDALLPDKNAKVLDVGAGTGLCGEALAESGFRDVVGVDFSDGMLRQAEQKGIYTQLVQHDVEEQFPWEKGSFDAAVASGVFTFGHAGAEALRHITEQLRAGGILVVTFRDDYLGSRPEIKETISDLPLELRSRAGITIFGDEPMSVLAFQKRPEATA